jgi:hypothetical protein
MDYRSFSVESWHKLDMTGNIVSGYKSVFLGLTDHQVSNLHIFIDESGKHHFAIEDNKVKSMDIDDPGINGLHIKVNQYRMKDAETATFVDIQCYIVGFLEIYTKVVKEIAEKILVEGIPSVEAVSSVIRKWKIFWALESKSLLSEDQQIGLICELLTLSNLCNINPVKALDSWIGPLGERHDFVFKKWSFEVKGSRRSERIHRINGIEQLDPLPGKDLILVSYRVVVTNESKTVSLQSIVDEFTNDIFINTPELIIKFNELLKAAGYNPMYFEEYSKFKIAIIDCFLFKINDTFPRLIPQMLKYPLSDRVSSLTYDISLSGVNGEKIDGINWKPYLL